MSTEEIINTIISIIEKLSQQYHCASWLTDIEHDIWNQLLEPDPDFTNYKSEEDLLNEMFCNYQTNIIKELRKLSAECKGWVRYNYGSNDFEHSRVFVPIDEWIKMHSMYVGREMTDEQRQRNA